MVSPPLGIKQGKNSRSETRTSLYILSVKAIWKYSHFDTTKLSLGFKCVPCYPPHTHQSSEKGTNLLMLHYLKLNWLVSFRLLDQYQTLRIGKLISTYDATFCNIWDTG